MSELPEDLLDEVERLTRLAREAVDEDEAAAYRAERDRRLAEHGFVARVREEETREVLVCYPDEWVEGGVVRTERIEDTDRAAERPLSGTGESDRWAEVEAHNREIVDAVADERGDVHAANAAAFADFMGNHHARRIESAGAREVRRFLEEYFPRNAWPSDEQREVVEESLRAVFDIADREPPAPLREEES